jgi:DNA-directed RNA polymerase subunit M/transcription elongation factor TFIIS
VLKTEPDVWPEEHVRFGTCVMTKPPRYTTETDAPDPPAPAIVCPTCDQRLVYLKTLIGGIRPTERWDFYQCETCHTMFEYRHRTRRLRIAESA